MLLCCFEVLKNVWILSIVSLGIVYFIWNLIVDKWFIASKTTSNVLITGCDSGFGHATALELSASKCKVYAGCLTEDGVQKLQNDEGFEGIAFIMDVTKEADIENARILIEEETKETGLHAIVNNAGIATPGLIEWQPIELMKKVFEVNYWGTVRVIKQMLPLLKKSRGRIINIASIAGRVSCVSYAAPYVSSKFAVESFSDSLRFEVKPWGIGVHLIEPMFYKTEITSSERVKKSWTDIWNSQPKEIKKEYSEETINNFITKIDEVIQALVSEDITEVSAKIKHAVLSRFPRKRYVVGKHCIPMVICSHLPTNIADWVLSSMGVCLYPDVKKEKRD